jgi:hypothetical protein
MDQGNAFAGAESLRIAEFDLGRPDSAGDMHPVIVGGSLQGLTRIDRAAHLFLLLAVVLGCSLGVLAFHPLPLLLLVCLLFMRR